MRWEETKKTVELKEKGGGHKFCLIVGFTVGWLIHMTLCALGYWQGRPASGEAILCVLPCQTSCMQI